MRVDRATLLLHGEEDRLIPIDAARESYELSASSAKQLVELPGAGHNDTVFRMAFLRRFPII